MCRIIGEVSDYPPPTNLRVDAIGMAPQLLMTPEGQEIFADSISGNTWTNRTPWQISRTRVDRSISITTPINSGISKTSTPDSSDSTGKLFPLELVAPVLPNPLKQSKRGYSAT